MSPDFCGTGDLQPIEARKTILGRDQLRNGGAGRLFTAVSVVLMGGDTVAIIGTQDGHIMNVGQLTQNGHIMKVGQITEDGHIMMVVALKMVTLGRLTQYVQVTTVG